MAEEERYGEIEKYDRRKQTGIIRDANGRRLHFHRRNFDETSEPSAGMNVTFLLPFNPNNQGTIDIKDIREIKDFDTFLREKKAKEEQEILERAAEEALRLKRERQQAEDARVAREAENKRRRKQIEREREAYRIQQERRETQPKEQERLAFLEEKRRRDEEEAKQVEREKLITDIENRFPIGSRVFFPKQGYGIVKQIKGDRVAVLFDSQKGGNPVWIPDNLLESHARGLSDAQSVNLQIQSAEKWIARESQLSKYLWKMRAEVLQTLAEEGEEAKNIYKVDDARDPVTPPQPMQIDPRITSAFYSTSRIKEFYSHQIQSREALLRGRSVIISTPTASGKTESYNPTILETLINDPDATALYLFPLVALGLDQTERLEKLNKALPESNRLRIGIYNNSISKAKKEETLRSNNRILVTTPDSLHYIFLPKPYPNWRRFYRYLRYVVIDEAHIYKGVFGANIANIVRRLLVRCRREGNPRYPQIIISSATVKNPQNLAQQLTGLPANEFEVITESGAPKPKRHFLVTRSDIHDLETVCGELLNIKTANPKGDGEHPVSTIVFLTSINEVKTATRALRNHLSRSGRSDEIELVEEFYSDKGDKVDVLERLRKGNVRCLFTTTALMAGIDIGSLDVAIVKNFPGLIMDARQMFGRAGRASEGAVIFIANRTNPFDHFYFDRPELLFQGPVEDVVANPENPILLAAHLRCAAQTKDGEFNNQEGPLADQWVDLFGQMGKDILNVLVDQKNMHIQGDRFHLNAGDPHKVEPLDNIRSASSETYSLINIENNEKLEDKRETTAFRDAHRDAIYSVSGKTYKVTDFDLSSRTIKCVPFYEKELRTRGLETLDVKIESKTNTRSLLNNGMTIGNGEIKITTSVSKYLLYKSHLVMQCRNRACRYETSALDAKRCIKCDSPVRPKQTEDVVDKLTIPTPPTLSRGLKTRASWVDFPASLEDRFSKEFWPRWAVNDAENSAVRPDFESALHSVEHAILKAFPEHISCDRDEIGGVYILKDASPIQLFIYDNFQGGLGLTDEFAREPRIILEEALDLIERCTCIEDQGCPVCLSYFGCHNSNQGLSKFAGRYLLRLLLGRDPSRTLVDLKEYVEIAIPYSQRVPINQA